jgi:hypothetical protein
VGAQTFRVADKVSGAEAKIAQVGRQVGIIMKALPAAAGGQPSAVTGSDFGSDLSAHSTCDAIYGDRDISHFPPRQPALSAALFYVVPQTFNLLKKAGGLGVRLVATGGNKLL